ncbi:MAG: iron-containing alcohol dehydrogenase [Steroidobacteraceae bacterium]
MNTFTAKWNYPTNIRFGVGRIAELPAACREFSILRPLLVTDPGFAKLPVLDSIVQSLRTAGLGVAVFSDVQGNPIEANVTAGVQVYRDGRHDGVIAIGGGSALDAGKSIALMSGQKRPIFDFEDREDWFTRIDVAGMAPVIAVPTTAGTGSEVGRAAVITDVKDHTKKIIFHPRMMPVIVIADPELTVGLPAHVTAATGMDALSHNLEAYCAPGFHPLADGIAVEGMRLVHDYLPRACENGADIEARANMLVASSMGATAFQKGLGAMHSMSHPCSANVNTHHGLTNAVVMPYVLLFNRNAIEDRIARLAAYLGLPKPGFDSFLDWVLTLRSRIGIVNTLAELKIPETHIRTLSEQAYLDPSTSSNPIAVKAADFEVMFRNAIRGNL